LSIAPQLCFNTCRWFKPHGIHFKPFRPQKCTCAEQDIEEKRGEREDGDEEKEKMLRRRYSRYKQTNKLTNSWS
jgi:hypothetical protein